jgi:UTP--glucose-1-phosphate uridylyltransferase
MGDGHAILSALPFVEKHEPVAILFGDDIISGKTPALKQLIDVYNEFEAPVIALQKVPKKDVSNYGVIGGKKVRDGAWKIDRFVEKPEVKEAPSDLIVIGRYIITPEIMQLLPKVAAGKDGEIRLADAFASYLASEKSLYGCQFEGTRYDCGSKLGFVKAQIELGLQHKDIGSELKKYLKQMK